MITKRVGSSSLVYTNLQELLRYLLVTRYLHVQFMHTVSCHYHSSPQRTQFEGYC